MVPLRIRERVVGVDRDLGLLQQKTTLQDVDYELFNLLGAHAASALQGAKLNAELDGPPARALGGGGPGVAMPTALVVED